MSSLRVRRLYTKRALLLLSVLLLTALLVNKRSWWSRWWSHGDKATEQLDRKYPRSDGVKHYKRVHVINAHGSLGKNAGRRRSDALPLETARLLAASSHIQKTSRACNALPRPGVIPDLQTWQKVGDPSTYVFSAYYDTRSHLPVVRVIAMSTNYPGAEDRKTMGGTHFCQVWFQHQRQPKVVPAEVGPIHEDHGRRYAAIFFLCYLPGRTPGIPVAVSVVRHHCETATNLLRVHYTLTPSMPLYNFTVCVTPLNRYYDNINQMTEMVEVNRMFGAQKFVFYNNSSGRRVNRLMESYMKDGLLQVVPWDLPVKTETLPPTPGVDIHYFAQLAALNDCLYRNIHTSRYIVFSDLDEQIVPRSHDTWSDLLDDLQNLYNIQNTASFLFGCTFFKTEWPDHDFMVQKEKVKALRSLTLLKTKREMKIWPAEMRSKYIAVPMRVDTVGVHAVLEHHKGYDPALVVPEKLGLLHHYRFLDDPRDTNWVVDDSMHRFIENITWSVGSRLQLAKLMK